MPLYLKCSFHIKNEMKFLYTSMLVFMFQTFSYRECHNYDTSKYDISSTSSDNKPTPLMLVCLFVYLFFFYGKI